MKFKKIVTIFLVAVLAVNCFSFTFADSNTATTVIACSDFQNPKGSEAGKTTVNNILSTMSANGLTAAEGFFCCGDYDYEYTDTKGGIDTLKEATSGIVYGDSVFVQGNHDSAIGTNGISTSGNRDPQSKNYGVFVINEDDYMWHNSDEARIKQTAQNLIDYLNDKLESDFSKPIFVISHLPLHYSMRTRNDGDGMHANYIFNVLNKAGEKGLNIIFLYGHDHSNGWDDYLGGSSVYLKKGDNILIAQNSRTVFEQKELKFTYANPGYTGYYDNHNGADDTLTMTEWLISEDSVTVKRYSANGIHPMKTAGVRNTYKNETSYSPNTDTYASPQVIELTDITDKAPIDDIIVKSGYKYRRIKDISELKDGGQYLLIYDSSPDYIMTLNSVTKPNTGSTRTGFDIISYQDLGMDLWIDFLNDYHWTFKKTADGWLIGNGVENITFTPTSLSSATANLSENGDIITIKENEDTFTFSAKTYSLNYNSRKLINGYNINPAEFLIYEFTGELTSRDSGKSDGYKYKKITDESEIKDGGKYVLVCNETSDYIMTLNTVTKTNSRGSRTGFDIVDYKSFGADLWIDSLLDYHWTFKKTDGGWLIGNGVESIAFTATSVDSATADLSENGDIITITKQEDMFTFADETFYLNYNSRKLINGYSENPAGFYIYEFTGELYIDNQLSLPLISMTLKNDFSLNYKLNKGYDSADTKVLVNGKEISDKEIIGDYIIFNHDGIYPHNLTKKFTLEFVSNGITIQKTTFSPSDYCYELLRVHSDNSKLCTLVTDILNFCTAAQIYKNQDTDNLANKHLSNEQKITRECGSAKNSISLTDGIEETSFWKSHALYLDSGISIKLGFTADDYENIYVSVQNEDGDEVTQINNFYISPYGKRYFYFNGVFANEIDDIYTFTIMKDGKAISETLSYSAESYIAVAKDNVTALSKTLLAYGRSAENYIN